MLVTLLQTYFNLQFIHRSILTLKSLFYIEVLICISMVKEKINVKERLSENGEIDLSMSDIKEVPVKDII